MTRPAWLCALAMSTGASAGVLAGEAVGRVETYIAAGIVALGSLVAVNRLDGVAYPAMIGADDREME